MHELNLANNLVRLRHERKITQEELADFIGVTKAAVSKWENRQSTPDILLLPQLAAFFGVTVDELLGYEAQLSQEQIRRCYGELAGDFRNLPFREAMEKTRALTHRYYSCYPFLLQAAVLYLNHCMLAETQEERREVLQEAEALCRRIQQGCNEVRICSDALSLQAILKLQMGELREVIEMLEETADPLRISAQNDMLLIQAYQAAGETEKAKSAVQIWQYLYVMNLIGASNQALSLYAEEPERCEEIIRRTEGILKLYEIDRLHPNAAAQFYYQAALLYAAGAAEEMALKKLEQFATCVCKLLDSEEILLHGDAYFDRLDEWIERLPLGAQAPRHRAFAEQSALEALSRPEFDALRETERFQKICRHIVEGGHCHA